MSQIAKKKFPHAMLLGGLRCQNVKKVHRGSQKKIHIMRFTHIDINFDIKYEGHQNTFYAHFDGFWSPSYVTTSMKLNVLLLFESSSTLLQQKSKQNIPYKTKNW